MPSSPPPTPLAGWRTTHPDGRDPYKLQDDGSSTTRDFCAKYFSVKSFLLLALVAVMLLVLPLVLPPLPPPPSVLLLVPVAMMAVLLALAFMPAGGWNDVADPTSYL